MEILIIGMSLINSKFDFFVSFKIITSFAQANLIS